MHSNMKNSVYSLVIGLFSFGYVSCSSSNESAPELVHSNFQFYLEPMLDSLQSPLQLIDISENEQTFCVVSQTGKISKYTPQSSSLTVYADLSTLMAPMDSTFAEMGLLSMALDPDYSTNHKFYAFYTSSMVKNIGGVKITVSSFVWSETNDQILKSEHKILELDHPGLFAVGGQLEFGPDGYLYIGIGSGDPAEAQNLTNMLGTVIRIDVTNNGDLPYAIPKDNPLLPNTPKEIFAFGFRNPYRFSFDSKTNQLLVADVGKGLNEEVNLIQSGKNYGWPKYEGDSLTEDETYKQLLVENNTFPLINLPHKVVNQFGIAITGIQVYRGNEFPDLQGKYITSDWNGDLYTSDVSNKDSIKTTKHIISNIHQYAMPSDTLIDEGEQLVVPEFLINSISVDKKGELYLLCQTKMGSFNYAGKLFKLVYKNE